MSRLRVPFKALPLLAAALMAGCVSIETAAPRVETFAGNVIGTRRLQLAEGRTIYITKCAKCHAPEPVRNYSLAKWREIIPDMMEDAKLSPAETEAVKAYVFAVLAGA